MKLRELYDFCSEFDLKLADFQLNLLEKYLNLVLETNKFMNLTAISEFDEGVEKHLFDSLLVAKAYNFNDKNVIDIGSGAGFPGIPLAIAFPNSTFTLVEPMTKRANFLKSIKETLNLGNVQILNERAEMLKDYREKFDISTARAVARLNVLLELLIPLTKVGGVTIALKGRQCDDEILEAKNALKLLSSEVKSIGKFVLPISKEERNEIVIIKNKVTDKKYPRNYSQISKRAL